MRKKELLRSTRQDHSQKGFTLIEVLITMMMLGITLMVMLSIFMYGFTVITRARQVNVATQIVQDEMEHIRNLSYDDLLAQDTGYSFSHDNLERLGAIEASVAIADGPGDEIKEVSVSVAWKYKGRKFYRTVSTYVTRNGLNKR